MGQKIKTTIYCAKAKTVKDFESMSLEIPDDIYDMPKKFSFDLESVCAITETIENDKIEPSKSTIYLKSGEAFVIVTPFEELSEKWENS